MIEKNYPWLNNISTEKCCEPNSIIEVKDLSLFYANKAAFKNISLTFNKGCVTGIIGPSGCGKSSFLQCLNRMIDVIPNTKVEGDISIDGKNIYDSRLKLNELRKKVSIVFQEPTPLPLSIEANISLPLKEHNYDCVEDRVENALKVVGLWREVKDKLKSPAVHLSGGQKQRMCLARSLALEPEIILMDEPCSSLDPISTDIIEALIHDLKGLYTIIVVTHNLAQARRVCDDIAAFWYDEKNACGKLIESGSCAEVFDNPRSPTLRDYVGGIKG